MRHPVSLVVSTLLSLLACSCSPDTDSSPNPYVNLVGSSRYISTNRLTTSPGDTLTSKVYAEANAEATLQRLRITVTYAPNKNPFVYPRSYDPNSNPSDPELVYLDTVLSQQKALSYQFTFNTRTTSGSELWKFEAYDTQQHTSSRSFRITLRNADSALVYHRYTVRLQQPRTATSRSFLALLPGLSFPSFTLRENLAAQQLIDLVYSPTAAGAPALATLQDKSVKLPNTTWPSPRITLLRQVAATDAGRFGTAVTTQDFTDIYKAGAAITTTGALTKGQLFAFLTADQKYGLISIFDIKTTPTPTLDLQVRVAK
jgi:hypothetical protein